MDIKNVVERQQRILDCLDEMVVLLDENCEVVFANTAVERILGYSPQEVLEKNWCSVLGLSEGDRDKLLARTRGKQPPLQGDLQLRHKDGTLRRIAWLEKYEPEDGLICTGRDVTSQIQEKEKLRDSEAKWRSITENSPDHILVLDSNFNIQFANYAAPGLTVEDLIGTPLYTYIPQDRQAEIKAILENILLTSTPGRYETEYTTLAGDIFYYEALITPITRLGENVGLTVSARNITERKQTEKALQESEARMQAVLDYAPALILTKDLNGTVTLANRRFDVLKGPPPEKIVGANINDIFPHELAETLWKNDCTVIKTHAPVKTEEPITHKDGTIHTYFTVKFPLYNIDRELDSTCTIATDITERKQAEIELRKLSRVVEQTADIVVITNRDGTIEYVNDAFEKNSGYTGVETLGNTPRILKSGEHSQSYYVDLWKTILSGKVFRGVMINKKESGQLYYEEKTITPLRDEYGEITHFVSTGKDITERMEAENELERLYNQTRQDADTKSLLLKEVNHRVKNNLSAIIGLLYAERRHPGVRDDEIYQSIMADLISRVNGLTTVHKMLSVSKWAPLNLSDIVIQLIYTSMQSLSREKRIFVDVTPSTIMVSSRQANNLALIINELTTNTIKYALLNRNKASITVSIKEEADGLIFLQFKNDGPDYPQEILQLENYNVGLYLVNSLVVRGLLGTLQLDNNNGAVATIRFKSYKVTESNNG